MGHDLAIKQWDSEVSKTAFTRKSNRDPYLIAFAADGTTIALSGHAEVGIGAKAVIKSWVVMGDVYNKLERVVFKEHPSEVISIAISPAGRNLALGNADGTLTVLDLPNGAQPITFKGHSTEVTSLAFSADGKLLVSGSKDKSIKLWDVAK